MTSSSPQRVITAADALAEVLEDPEFDVPSHEPRRKALLDALMWLELDHTCGDCIEGRCHWGGEKSRASIAAAEAGRDYLDPEPGGGRCGCARHDVSVRARQRRARLRAAGVLDG
ncbi:hypothetical protein [Saccharopolyspora taberi]|uniref:Uncharacterized protein n=1 Tax=Saccharopolyspora taberi TaxID=60895 RepID=A0ABN3V861_9PSEU